MKEAQALLMASRALVKSARADLAAWFQELARDPRTPKGALLWK